MINEVTQAMIEQAPEKARDIQRRGKGKLTEHVSKVVNRAAENVGLNQVENDPALEVMLREMAQQDALDELINN